MLVTSSVDDGAAWIPSAGIICPHFVVVVVVYMVVYILYVLLLFLMFVSKK